MNDNVRVYHVDEYCEGASHFNFRGERKDVVLLEDYEKLRDENESLRKRVNELESIPHTDNTAVIEALQRDKDYLIELNEKRIARVNELEEQLLERAKRECVLCKKKIRELEDKNNVDYIQYQRKTQEQAKRISELEQALDMASDPALYPNCDDCDKCSVVTSKLETTEPKWVSVKDRLPGGNPMLPALTEEGYKIWWGNWHDDNLEIYGIAYWLDNAFPPPPKTEEK